MHHVIVQPCQTCHNNNLNHSTITMKAVSAAQRNHILSLLDSGYSGHDISSQTGVSNATISILRSRHRPYVKKASGGHPSKLSEQDLHYAIQLIGTGKAENAVQVAKLIQDSTNQSLSAQTV
jgi:transposase